MATHTIDRQDKVQIICKVDPIVQTNIYTYYTTDVFDQKQIAFVSILLSHYEGRTEKQKNPYSNGQLAWATWIIARIGGRKGYRNPRLAQLPCSVDP